jgi:hypothetical protein
MELAQVAPLRFVIAPVLGEQYGEERVRQYCEGMRRLRPRIGQVDKEDSSDRNPRG